MSKPDDKAAMTFAMGVLGQMPKGDRQVMEDHMTAVLVVFWGALWGTFGTEFAKGFIESQLRGMEGGNVERYVKTQH
jgi:hypothetical protein